MIAEILSKPEKLSERYYILKIKAEINDPIPGQFINIKIGDNTDPLIRRPFSIFNHENGIIEIIFKLIGKGTDLLHNYEKGKIDIIGPLGKGFSMIKNKKALLIGGGVGCAPLFYLGNKLKDLGNEVIFVYGAQTAEQIYLKDLYKKITDKIFFITDDGSEGRKGYASDITEEMISSEKVDFIFTCGPSKMMKKIVSMANYLPVEISVENYFGCGIGLCSGCNIETAGGPKRSCIDGPVFNGKDINWEYLLDLK